jgi:AP2-associated kinase
MKLGWHRGKKDATAAPLLGKVVQVGEYHVKLEAALGDGGFACVYRARDMKENKVFAMKHLRLAGNPEASLEVQLEAKTMAKLRGHPNILYLHAVAFAGPKGAETDAFMLLDLCPQTLLFKLQSSHNQMDDLTIVEAFGDILQGVAHMHSHNPPYTHRWALVVQASGRGRCGSDWGAVW